MKKLEIVRYLLDEIEAEQNKQTRYEKEQDRAQKESDKTGKRIYYTMKWDETYPHKSRITENCKIVRRMMMEISREVNL
jgi:hypothetical protein